MKLRPSKIAIMIGILEILHRYKMTFCWPTQDTMLWQLSQFHHIVISDRTLRQHLMELRDMGFIKSYRRYGVKPDGTLYNKPSNRQLTLKAFKFLKSLKIRVEDWLWKWALTKILPFRAKKHRPANDPKMNQIRTGGGTASLREIMKNIIPPSIQPAK